jgi:hypothetical protein
MVIAESITERKHEIRRVKNVSFFAIFQLRSSGYAPSKMQKLTKNQPVFATGRES